MCHSQNDTHTLNLKMQDSRKHILREYIFENVCNRTVGVTV